VRVIVAAVIACTVAVLACVQIGSEAIYGRLPLALGVRIYEAIDRVAPAEYVLDMLGTTALAQHDLDAAQHYAVQMPAGPRRDDLLAQIAQASGQDILAREYYFAAADADAMQREIHAVSLYNIAEAAQLEERFRARLIALGTHPDAVAQSYLLSGNFETWQRHFLAGAALDERALALAPMNMGYLLSAANDAYLGGDLATAQRLFTRGTAIDPASGDCYAGLGLIAVREGQRDRARAYLRQARTVEPHAPMIPALETALR